MNAAPLNVRPEAINARVCTMVPAVHPRCGRAGEVGPCVGSIRKRSPAPARRAAGISRAGARSEEHTSELQSLMRISYAVFCLKKKKRKTKNDAPHPHYEPTTDSTTLANPTHR